VVGGGGEFVFIQNWASSLEGRVIKSCRPMEKSSWHKGDLSTALKSNIVQPSNQATKSLALRLDANKIGKC
jgi:hypothetical protein